MAEIMNQKMSEYEFQKYLENQIQKLNQTEMEKSSKKISADCDVSKQVHMIISEINNEDKNEDNNNDKDKDKCLSELLSLSNDIKQGSNDDNLHNILNLINSLASGSNNNNNNNITDMLTTAINNNSIFIDYCLKNYITKNINIYKTIFKTFSSNNIMYQNFDEMNINKGGKFIISNHLNLSDSFLIFNKLKTSTFIIADITAINKLLKYFNFKDTIIEDNFIDLFNIIYYDPDKNGNGNDVKNEMLKLVNENKNILLFPEGGYGRSYTKIKQFKLGGLKLAYDNKIPIVPIVLYYSNKNHYHILPLNSNSIYDFIMESLAIYKHTGDIIIHQCNDGKDVLPLPNESFETFHKRLHNMMQSQITKFNKKYNREIE